MWQLHPELVTQVQGWGMVVEFCAWARAVVDSMFGFDLYERMGIDRY
jgi:hypothetical protein